MAIKLFQGLLLIGISPAIFGTINWLKAIGQGRTRKIAYVFQPYRDILKLMRVPAIYTDTTSWIFRITPSIVFLSYAFLAFTVPVIQSPPLVVIDLIVVMYILGLARFILSLSSWDTAASLSEMGSSRVMYMHLLSEIGLIFVLATLALRWKTLNLTAIIQEHDEVLVRLFQQSNIAVKDIDLIFLFIALGFVLLFELERIPIGNPESHLELTMAQRAIMLEYAGHHLAFLEWAEMIKLGFLFALFGNLFIPYDVHHWLGNSLLFMVRMLILILGIVWMELRRPRMRLRLIARLAWGSVIFSLIAISLVVFTRNVS